MNDDEKKNKGEPIDGVLYHHCPDGHMHAIGRIDGVLHRNDTGEVVYEDKNSSFVGGGNPRYSANYDKMDWN